MTRALLSFLALCSLSYAYHLWRVGSAHPVQDFALGLIVGGLAGIVGVLGWLTVEEVRQ